MGRFIDFLTSSAIAQVSAWATEHMATLRKTGCADPDPVKAARRFADYCIRNGMDQDDEDRARREPVGHFRVGDGLWRPVAIQGKAKAPDPNKLRAWMDWRLHLVFKAVRGNHNPGAAVKQ